MGMCQNKELEQTSKQPNFKAKFPEAEEQDDTNEETTQLPIEGESVASNQKLSMQDFELIKVIGRGSFGKVLLVKKLDDQQLLAVKILRKNMLSKKKYQDQAIQERNIMSQINSPFFVKLRYAFQSPSRLYMVMDFMQGGELFLHLKKNVRFPEEWVQFYAAEILVAIDLLHKSNIMYRDLKPENILLDKSGHIVLTDFGLSKLGFEKNEMTYTFCGTPEYVAPEILYQRGHTFTVDFYSYGALIYEMLSGTPPHYSKNKKEMLKNRCEKPLEMRSCFSFYAASLLKGLLTKDPGLRLGSNGIKEIKKHNFFNGIDWKLVEQRKLQPPIIPKIQYAQDLSNFDAPYLQQPIVDTPESKLNETFVGFTYHQQM
ncbi:unnamed protein product (macronuclear) [Paramecium tetraurelia]|uniref:Protein kinase domain-containing protein n=1 Tax=Paramecium tetraurelia TaxID=5888 RepID=A0EI85_PARTE|nr:uncharacterized protein GSPATT00027355001 [Paramecium tetraurelia]CAK95026.1 unnamed protein product [Paramecium tetraurelia]|eukprot:XP_001462399.1 hypothetical protein (macronuclear) [Paramecium tetraurelia strain d4-2]